MWSSPFKIPVYSSNSSAICVLSSQKAKSASDQPCPPSSANSQLQQMFDVGQSVSCKVITFHEEQKKITLGLTVMILQWSNSLEKERDNTSHALFKFRARQPLAQQESTNPCRLLYRTSESFIVVWANWTSSCSSLGGPMERHSDTDTQSYLRFHRTSILTDACGFGLG